VPANARGAGRAGLNGASHLPRRRSAASARSRQTCDSAFPRPTHAEPKLLVDRPLLRPNDQSGICTCPEGLRVIFSFDSLLDLAALTTDSGLRCVSSASKSQVLYPDQEAAEAPMPINAPTTMRLRTASARTWTFPKRWRRWPRICHREGRHGV